MIVWNTAAKKIEAGYDGKIFEFAPNERKKIYNPDIYNHLFVKIQKEGLVLLDEETLTPETEKKALLEGLKARWKTMDYVVRNFRTMNKDRESNKLAADSPSEIVMDAADEAADLLEKIKELDGERHRKVNNYLNDPRPARIAAEIEASQPVVETKGAFETQIGPKRPGKQKRDAVSSAANKE